MNIYGKDYNFLLTVGAASEISDLCPDGDMERLPEVFSGSFAKTARTAAKLMVALSKGYEEAQSFAAPGYEMHPLTEALVMSLPQDVFMALQSEAVDAFTASMKTEVEVDAKKNEAAK